MLRMPDPRDVASFPTEHELQEFMIFPRLEFQAAAWDAG